MLPLSFVNMVIVMADVGILAILFPLFLHARGLPPRAIGLLVALVMSTQVGALIAGSRLADRWEKLSVLTSALLLYATGLAGLSMACSLEQILPATLVTGAGSGAARAVPSALVGDLAKAPVRGAAMGIFRAFTDIGMISGPALLGLWTARASYPSAFLATGGLLIANIGVLMFNRRFLTRHDKG